jgi:hypothetical protein
MTTPLTPEQRMKRLLELIAEQQRACIACGVPLYMVRHSNGKVAPYTEDGANHSATCPDAERFRRPAKRREDDAQPKTDTARA